VTLHYKFCTSVFVCVYALTFGNPLYLRNGVRTNAHWTNAHRTYAHRTIAHWTNAHTTKQKSVKCSQDVILAREIWLGKIDTCIAQYFWFFNTGFSPLLLLFYIKKLIEVKHTLWRGGWGIFSPSGVTRYSNLQKASPCAETRRLSH